jgi:hypothetical protein
MGWLRTYSGSRVMKKTGLGIIAFFIMFNIAHSQELYPVEIDGDIGYINPTGETVILPEYQTKFKEAAIDIGSDKPLEAFIIPEYAFFSEGIATVRVNEYLWFIPISYHYEIIDSVGTTLFETEEEIVFNFHEGLAVKQSEYDLYEDEHINLFGYVNKLGEWEIAPRFEFAGHFSDGAALVLENGNFAFINKKGKKLHELRFDDAHSYSEGMAPVKIGNLWGFIDKKGDFAIEPKYYYAGQFRDGIARVMKDSTDRYYYFIDKNDDLIIETGFRKAYEFSGGLALVENNGKVGYLNTEGEYAITPQYEKAGSFSGGYAPVKKLGKWGYINKEGEMAHPAEFDYAGGFRAGLAPVWKNGGMYYINKKWQIVHTAYED